MMRSAFLVLVGTASLSATWALPQKPDYRPAPLPGMQVKPLSSGNDALVRINDTTYWTPLEANVVDAQPANAGRITIGNYRVGRELPQSMITAGLVISETVLYESQYPPDDQIFRGGIEFTYLAKYTHRFWIDPNTGVKISWLDTDNVIDALNSAVFQTSAHKELLFDIRRDGVKVGIGGITDSAKPTADQTFGTA